MTEEVTGVVEDTGFNWTATNFTCGAHEFESTQSLAHRKKGQPDVEWMIYFCPKCGETREIMVRDGRPAETTEPRPEPVATGYIEIDGTRFPITDFKVDWGPQPDLSELQEIHDKYGDKIRTRVADGEISTEERLNDIATAGVELRGSGNDEAPRAYKRLPEVLAAQGETIEILHQLAPIGVAMAGGERE